MESLTGQFEAMTDEDLCAACAARPVNEAAWQVLYARFLPFVYDRVRHGLRLNLADVPDVVQEAFLRIFGTLQDYDPGRAKFKTFLSRVVANLVIDHWRHGSELRANSVSLEDVKGTLQLKARHEPQILRLAAERLIGRIEDAGKVALVCDLLDGEQVKDLCRKYGLSASSVYKTRLWVMNQLRMG